MAALLRPPNGVTAELLCKRHMPGVTDIDSALQSLFKLSRVDLSFCELETLSGIELCSEVVELDVSDNLLVELEFLEFLPKLRVLNSAGNKIRLLPDLSSLDKLEVLNVCDNPLESLEPDKLPVSLKAIDLTNTLVVEDPTTIDKLVQRNIHVLTSHDNVMMGPEEEEEEEIPEAPSNMEEQIKGLVSAEVANAKSLADSARERHQQRMVEAPARVSETRGKSE